MFIRGNQHLGGSVHVAFIPHFSKNAFGSDLFVRWYTTIQHFLTLLFTAGDNGPYTDSPQDFLATEPEDIGQDIVFLTNPAQEEVSISEATAKGGEEQQHAHTANPVKQGPVQVQSPTLCYDKDPPLAVELEFTTPPSDHQVSTKDTWEQIEKANYPESYLPAPEDSLNTDHEESHIFPTTSPETSSVVTVGDAATLPTANGTDEHHISENETLDMIVCNAESVTDAGELLNSSSDVHQEGDLPVLQEDHTSGDHLQHPSETELTYTSTSYDASQEPEEASAATAEVESAVTTSPHVEEPDVNSSPPENHPTEEESGDESSSQYEDPQNLVTQSLAGVDTYATSDLVSTTGSGKSTVSRKKLC